MISIIMTAFNAQRYIHNAIESIINQTYTDWELIVVDDASTDKTFKILMDYRWKKDNKINKDINLTIIRKAKNEGHTKCLNTALESCQGDYIAWHDADDVSLPTRFEKQVAILQNHPTYGFVTTHGITINENGNRTENFYTDEAQREKKTTITDKFKDDCWLLLPSMMFRRSVIDKIGGFDEECYYGQDFNFVYRMLMAKYNFEIIPEELFKFRKHKGSVRASGKFLNRNWHKFAIERAKKCPIIK